MARTTKDLLNVKEKKKIKKPVIASIVGVFGMLLGAAIMIFVLLMSARISVSFYLLGESEVTQYAEESYLDAGFYAKVRNVDVSDEVVRKIYNDKNEVIPQVSVDVVGVYYVTYTLTVDDISSTLVRRVNIIAPLAIDDVQVHMINGLDGISSSVFYIKVVSSEGDPSKDVDILVDAGSTRQMSTVVCDYLEANMSDNVIDYLIPMHEKGIYSLIGEEGAENGVLDKFEVRNVIQFASASTLTTNLQFIEYYQKLQSAFTGSSVEYPVTSVIGTEFNIGSQVNLKVLDNYYYDSRYFRERDGGIGDSSTCFVIKQAGNKFLFTGSLSITAENKFVRYNDEADISKVQLFVANNHGSVNSNSEALISVIKPKYVFIPCYAGDQTENPSIAYNFYPSEAVIERFYNYTDKIYVSSLNGNTVFTCVSKPFDITIVGSINSTILTESDWFRENRVLGE